MTTQRMPGTDAARHGTGDADLTIMIAAHDAFRRDLTRLARNQLITRRPHANTYDLTPDGLKFAIFYTKVHDRVLAPLFTAGQPPAPPQLRDALRTIQQHIDQRLADARLPAAA